MNFSDLNKNTFNSVRQGRFMADQETSKECISFVTVLQGVQLQLQR